MTVLVPYAAGGSVDVVTRVIAKAAGSTLGRVINVANVPGASRLLAVKRLRLAEPDGCTLLAATPNTVILLPLLNANAGFTTLDLQPLTMTGTTSLVLVASPASGLKSMADLHRAAHGGLPVRAGHPGMESLQAASLMLLQRKLQVLLTQVPYSGAGQMVNDLAGGHIDIAVLAKPVALPLIQHGAVVLLGNLTETDGYVGGSWNGWFAARGVAAGDLKPTTEALEAAMKDVAVADALGKLGVQTTAGPSGEAFGREIASTVDRLRLSLGIPPAAGDTAPAQNKLP